MANSPFIITHSDNTPQGGTGHITYYVADTDAGKPVTGLNVGDICYCLDSKFLYFANSATTWASKTYASEALMGALLLGTSAAQVYLVGDGAVGVSLQILPTDPGGTLISNYLAQTLYAKTLDGPTLVAPVVVNTSGTGQVRVGEWATSNAYGAIGLAGSVAAGAFNIMSSPGDTNLYVNRPTGKVINFGEGGGGPQLSLIAGGALVGLMDTMTYAATISLNVTLGNTHKTTLTGNATINASAAGSGDQHMTVILVNDATLARTTTFGTNFRSAGVLVGTISKVAVVKFVSDGAAWFEESRTLVL